MNRILALLCGLMLLATPPLLAQDTPEQATEEKTPAELKRETRVRQAAVWKSLPGSTRAVISKRAKYIYKFNDELILDAYELFHWQDEAKRNISSSTSGSKDNWGRTTRSHTSYSYKHDARFMAYYSVSGQPVSFWYRGVYLNDSRNWHDERLSEEETLINNLMAVYQDEHSRTSADDYNKLFRVYLDVQLPRVIAVDPLMKRKYAARRPSAASRGAALKVIGLFNPRIVPEGFLLSLGNTAVGYFTESPDMTSLYRASGSISPLTASLNISSGVFQDGRLLRKGEPKLDRFIMVPVGMTDRTNNSIGYGSHLALYDAQDLRQYAMTAPEVAEAFVNGELGIQYRELERVGSDFRCIIKTLERPE